MEEALRSFKIKHIIFLHSNVLKQLDQNIWLLCASFQIFPALSVKVTVHSIWFAFISMNDSEGEDGSL